MLTRMLLAALATLLANMAAANIKPFTSDGCSAFPDGTITQKSLWLSCCKEHDVAYWMGGSSQERLAADKSLEACVERAGEPEVAKLMLLGVRVGGSPYLPTKFRWGYGWPYFRGYKSISEKERLQIEKYKR
jgi:hypothetical protein